MHVIAIKDAHAWSGMTPAQLFMRESHLCLAQGISLNHVTSKQVLIILLRSAHQLLLPWRLFRLWALMDELDPPENMIRCMADNYSALGFWRAWHRSYKFWIVRYFYILLGGARHLAATSILIFTFVALA